MWECPFWLNMSPNNSAQRLADHFKIKLDISLNSQEFLFNLTHHFSNMEDSVDVFLCKSSKHIPHTPPHHLWVTRQQIHQLPMNAVNVRIVNQLKKNNFI
jgi:hypothetical protein